MPARARDLLGRAVPLWRQLGAEHELDLAAALDLLGQVQLAVGNRNEAHHAYESALMFRRRLLGPRNTAVARTLNGLAGVLRQDGRATDAEALSREALSIDSASGPAGRAQLAESLAGLADALAEQGAYARAEPLYRSVLAMLHEDTPNETGEIARARLGLATALRYLGQPASADSLARSVLVLYRRLTALGIALNAEQLVAALRDLEIRTSADITSPTSARGAAPAGRPHVPSAVPSDTGDGALIAFVTDRDHPDPVGDLGHHAIYVMNEDGSGQRRLTDLGPSGWPTWSPDGTRIAYESSSSGMADIFIISLNGGPPTRLTHAAPDGLGARRPAWSPDGKRIAFQSFLRPQVRVINVDGTGDRLLADSGGFPSWSPDGRQIAFASERDGDREIYVMDADGSHPRQLTNNPAPDRAPSWSPDGEHIVFVSARDGTPQIYLMRSDGSEQRRLTIENTEHGRPSWSPDGRKILFYRRYMGHGQLFTMNADGSGVARLTEPSATSFNAFASWGPPHERR
jgi:TolB protein